MIGKNIFDSVGAALIGLHKEEGEFEVSKGDSRISIEAVCYAFFRLSKEFPDMFFKINFREAGNGIFVSEEIDIIVGGMGIVSLCYVGHYEHLVIPGDKKRLINLVLQENLPSEELDKLVLLSKRFQELVEEFLAK